MPLIGFEAAFSPPLRFASRHAEILMLLALALAAAELVAATIRHAAIFETAELAAAVFSLFDTYAGDAIAALILVAAYCRHDAALCCHAYCLFDDSCLFIFEPAIFADYHYDAHRWCHVAFSPAPLYWLTYSSLLQRPVIRQPLYLRHYLFIAAYAAFMISHADYVYASSFEWFGIMLRWGIMPIT